MHKRVWRGIYLSSFAIFAVFLILLFIGLPIQIDGVLVQFGETTMTITLVLGALVLTSSSSSSRQCVTFRLHLWASARACQL